MTAPLLDLDDNRVQKKGHRTIWVPYLDARGRTFHQKQEDNGGIPGTYMGLLVNGTWVALGLHGHDGPEGPLWSATQPETVPTWHQYAVWALDRGMRLAVTQVQYAPGRGWGLGEPFIRALLARHADATVCDGCDGPLPEHGAGIDARTVLEPVYCHACIERVSRAMAATRATYREMECACGTPCYVQVSPAVRERGPWHDVLPCPKCARLACAECLSEGAKSCRGCVKTRRRKAA